MFTGSSLSYVSCSTPCSSSKGRSESPSLDLAFERHVDKVLARLHERLIGLRDPASRHGEILMAKHGLYDMAFQELITIFDQGSSPSNHVQGDDHKGHQGDGLTAQTLRSLSLVHTELLEAMHSLLIASTNERTMETTRLASKVEAMEQNETKVLHAAEVLGREAGATDHDLILLREENRRLRETMSEMQERHRADGLELQQLRRDVVDIAASGSRLWANTPSVPTTPAPTPSSMASEVGVPPPATPAGLAPVTPQNTVGVESGANVTSNGTGPDPKPEPKAKPGGKVETKAEVKVEAPVVRKLTLVQLKEHMNEIYKHSSANDEAGDTSEDAGEGRDGSLEEQMYTYLQERYVS